MNKEEWRRLITETLKETGLYSDNARDLIMGTFAQESNFKYTRQIGGGPALGYGQMEPATFNDIVVNFLRHKPELMGKVMKVSGVVTLEPEMLVDNKKLMICMARIHYLRVKEALPQMLSKPSNWKKEIIPLCWSGMFQKTGIFPPKQSVRHFPACLYN